MTGQDWGIRLLMITIGLWVILRSVTKDQSGRTLIDHILGKPADTGFQLQQAGATAVSSAISQLGGTRNVQAIQAANNAYQLGSQNINVPISSGAASTIAALNQQAASIVAGINQTAARIKTP